MSIPTPRRVIGNSKGEGSLKGENYESKMEFPEGWGLKPKKKPSVGGVWMLSGTTHTCTIFAIFKCCIFSNSLLLYTVQE